MEKRPVLAVLEQRLADCLLCQLVEEERVREGLPGAEQRLAAVNKNLKSVKTALRALKKI